MRQTFSRFISQLTHRLLLLVVCALVAACYSDPVPDQLWDVHSSIEVPLTSPGPIIGYKMARLGNDLVVGGYRTDNSLRQLALVFRLDPAGKVIWKWSDSTRYTSTADAIAVAGDGSIYVAGKMSSVFQGAGYPMAMKFSSDGTLLWQKQFGGTDIGGFQSMKWTGSDLLLVGYASAYDASVPSPSINYNVRVVRITTEGEEMWSKTFGGAGVDTGTAIINGTDGSIFIAAQTASIADIGTGNHGKTDVAILKLTTNGDIIWQKIFGSSNEDRINSMAFTPDQGLVMAGYSNRSATSRAWDMWISKLDVNGSVVWEEYRGGKADEVAASVAVGSDGRILLLGTTYSYDAYPDAWLVGLNQAGQDFRSSRTGEPSVDLGFDLILENSGDLTVLYAGSDGLTGHIEIASVGQP